MVKKLGGEDSRRQIGASRRETFKRVRRSAKDFKHLPVTSDNAAPLLQEPSHGPWGVDRDHRRTRELDGNAFLRSKDTQVRAIVDDINGN